MFCQLVVKIVVKIIVKIVVKIVFNIVVKIFVKIDVKIVVKLVVNIVVFASSSASGVSNFWHFSLCRKLGRHKSLWKNPLSGPLRGWLCWEVIIP